MNGNNTVDEKINGEGLISDNVMGDVWPTAEVGNKVHDYGNATISPNGPVEIRSFQTLTLTYVAGRFGLDDTGGIKVVQRFSNDGGRLQAEDSKAMNYVTAHTSNGTNLSLDIERHGHQRPWERSLRIVVRKGSLSQGDTITVVLGDTSQGSPGLRMQTFCESAHEFRVLVDACATGHFVPLADRPHVPIVAAKPYQWRAVLPTLRTPGEAFSLGLRADDIWGNPSHQAGRKLVFKSTSNIKGLPSSYDFPNGQRAVRIEGLSAHQGTHQIEVLDEDGVILTLSNLLVVREGDLREYWGDLHGQSGETVGVNPIREYYEFGRTLSFLDAISHQANDFQIKNQFWEEINTVNAEFNSPGKLVTFPGYEWSGNSPTGGDHNVYFRNEGCRIRRSSHALIEDASDIQHDANTTAELFESLKDEDCVLYAHIGGRPANLFQADGGTMRTALELHSDWGTFEWLMADNFQLGYRHGVVCNSDGHKGRPGASHPGASQFGAFGGLTCFLTSHLTRDGIFEALRRRHHYGTTGNRLHLDVRAHFDSPARIFHSDPRIEEAESNIATEAVMGDIVATRDAEVEISVEVSSGSPVLSVDVLNGTEIYHTEFGYTPDDLGTRYRVTFHGAEYRGRGRQVNWKGTACFNNGLIKKIEPINVWNHERLLEKTGESEVNFDIMTTGNFQGFDAWLATDEDVVLEFSSNLFETEVDLKSLGIETHIHDTGGLERAVRVTRLPDQCNVLEVNFRKEIKVSPQGDTPLWVRVTTEDGHIAWSSPIYVFREA